MRKYAFWALLAALLIALSLVATAQDTQDPEYARLLQENIFRAGVNTNPYEYLPASETPVPKGYKPFYISHYGRHGSRSDWGDGYPLLVEFFTQAKEAGILTQDGEAALERLQQIIVKHDGMNGRLTLRGQKEHRQIASRMYKKYKKLFRGGARKVRAISSMTQRCIISMASFCGELQRLDPSLEVTMDTGEKIMLICSTGDSNEVKPAAKELLKQHHDAYPPHVDEFFATLFTDKDKALEIIKDPVAFMDGFYYMAAISGAFDLDAFLLGLIPFDDLYRYCENRCMDLYLRQCNSLEFGDLRMPPVRALVDDVIDKADDAIANGTVQADLRFGHDWQLLAFCSWIGIENIGNRWDHEACRPWQGFLYTPFAGNLQMVFYRNRQGNVLVKFYINERETRLLNMDGGPYYNWEDVKKAWLR